MKTLAVTLLAVLGLSGCVAYPVESSHAHRGYHERQYDRDRAVHRGYRDRDGDGVRNRYDRRPDNPRRY